MARLIRYKANTGGESRLARSAGMRAMLVSRAGRVRSVAESGYESAPPRSGHVEVDVISDSMSRVGFQVARVAVIARHPAALGIEAARRVLGGSLDAARG